jgi:parvulin-like peptidyl-prolyl isomerase
VDDRVVSTVDGAPITLGQVQDLARETGLAPLAALRRLQEESVLLAQAEAQGLSDAPDVRSATQRAAVRAFLRARIEGPFTPESFSDEEVRARAERDARSFTRDERRRSTHVLAEVAADAPAALSDRAMVFIREAIEQMETAADPVAEAHSIASSHPELPFRVRVEDLPPVEREGPLVSEYSNALFSRETPGVVGEPVRTRFGWHAVVVNGISPAWQIPESEIERTVRKELAVEARAHALDSLIEELVSHTSVEINESAFRGPSHPQAPLAPGDTP